MKQIAIALAIVVVVVVVIGAVMMMSMSRQGFSTHEEPSTMEAAMARAMRRGAVPPELRDRKNPLPLAAVALERGRAHWADHCAVCHGNDGKGKTLIGTRLYPRAPDMTEASTQSLSDGELFSVIENGIRLTGMPGWGDGTAATAKGSWELVHFIRHLPAMTAEELQAMGRLNPKTPAANPGAPQGGSGHEQHQH